MIKELRKERPKDAGGVEDDSTLMTLARERKNGLRKKEKNLAQKKARRRDFKSAQLYLLSPSLWIINQR